MVNSPSCKISFSLEAYTNSKDGSRSTWMAAGAHTAVQTSQPRQNCGEWLRVKESALLLKDMASVGQALAQVSQAVHSSETDNRP
jgi:hypothetical protein